MLKRLWQQVTDLLRWIKEQVQSNPLVSLPAMALFLLLIWIIRETHKANNMGFNNKTFWDWMELLIIPTVLAIGALLFNRAERRTGQEIAVERFQEAALRTYLDRMTELLLDRGLLESERDAEVRIVAEAQTLMTLRILDGKRKGVILKFLSDAGLIKTGKSLVFLQKADLRKADLSGADLYEADLGGANLCGADLRGALLCKSCLIETDLREALLGGGDLRGTDLRGANLSGADLHEALLEDADLLDADLSGANLRMAFVTNESLSRARSLKGATLPNGTIHQ